MNQFILTLAAVLLLIASVVVPPRVPWPHPLLPHPGWFGLFLYVLLAAMGAYGIGR